MVADLRPVHLLALAAVAGALLWAIRGNAFAVGAGVTGAAVEVVEGAIVGGVESIGGVFGIPVTDETECEKAIREGRTWDASFACPAGRFLKSIFE